MSKRRNEYLYLEAVCLIPFFHCLSDKFSINSLLRLVVVWNPPSKKVQYSESRYYLTSGFKKEAFHESIDVNLGYR